MLYLIMTTGTENYCKTFLIIQNTYKDESEKLKTQNKTSVLMCLYLFDHCNVVATCSCEIKFISLKVRKTDNASNSEQSFKLHQALAACSLVEKHLHHSL